MRSVVAIGEEFLLEGFSLAGVRVEPADEPDECREALESIGDDAGLLLLTPASRAALDELLGRHPNLLWTVVG